MTIKKVRQSIGLVGTVTDNINDQNDNAVANTKTVKGYVDNKVLTVKTLKTKVLVFSKSVTANAEEIIGVNYKDTPGTIIGSVYIGSICSGSNESLIKIGPHIQDNTPEKANIVKHISVKSSSAQTVFVSILVFYEGTV